MLATSNFEDDKMKIKLITRITLIMFLASTLTITFNLLPVSGQTPLWTYWTDSSNRHVIISSDGSFVATGTADGKVHGLPDAWARAYVFPDRMALISEKKFLRNNR